MKPNMKRSIIITIIYCMGIGALTFFIGALYPIKNNDGVAEALNKDKGIIFASDNNKTDLEKDASKSDKYMPGSALASTVTATPIPTPEVTPTPAPTAIPTPLPVYEMTVGGYPEIEKFFQDYYVAWNSCDYGLIESLNTRTDNLTSLSDLQKETQFLDDIRDLTCYVTKSYEEGTYIVYVYYEMKYVNIKTTLPKLDKFYLITDDTGNLNIFNSDMDDTLKTYYDEKDQDEMISSIIKTTKEKADAALENDEDLRVYVEALKRY
ncbi:MAG: hypothetical protein EWM47_03790 [Anaerolineaceae bacterium]|nr:MAG: hypothetical protein EWM47_03790 [Anaerolineaceae bacterium]